MAGRQVAIACQGGGFHAAFAYGVLRRLLQAKIDGDDRFDICGLSGTSAGALCAFMTWYGLMPKPDRDGDFYEAQSALDRLWTVFSAQTPGEMAVNSLIQRAFLMEGTGLEVRHPAPPKGYDWMMMVLNGLSTLGTLFDPANLGFTRLRPEFFDFAALLEACAPEFEDLPHEEIRNQRLKPRLLVGAVEILSGAFEAFDSFAPVSDKPEDRPFYISLEAVQASGTLPEIRRSQRVSKEPSDNGEVGLYWDGLFSQNPPVREFVARTALEDIPDELWIVRINPQKRGEEPILLAEIEDRRNELAGNLSLNQELYFIDRVNAWVARNCETDPKSAFVTCHKPIDLYVITMAPSVSDDLQVASKFDRTPNQIDRLRRHGEEQAEAFLRGWGLSPRQVHAWPKDALDE